MENRKIMENKLSRAAEDAVIERASGPRGGRSSLFIRMEYSV